MAHLITRTADRMTHVMRKTKNELRRLMVAGFYKDIDLPEPQNTLDDVEKKIAERMGFRATSDDRYKLLEMQVYLDLPGYEDKDEKGKDTGIGLPYIVTIEKTSQEILAIRRNWHPEDETCQKRITLFTTHTYPALVSTPSALYTLLVLSLSLVLLLLGSLLMLALYQTCLAVLRLKECVSREMTFNFTRRVPRCGRRGGND